MSEGFRVDGEDLEAHLSRVETLAERTRLAAGTATPLRRDAYGLIGQLFAAMADGASRTASQGVADLAGVLHRHCNGIRDSRAAYVQVDASWAQYWEGLR